MARSAKGPISKHQMEKEPAIAGSFYWIIVRIGHGIHGQSSD
jgi:hypothetical protein